MILILLLRRSHFSCHLSPTTLTLAKPHWSLWASRCHCCHVVRIYSHGGVPFYHGGFHLIMVGFHSVMVGFHSVTLGGFHPFMVGFLHCCYSVWRDDVSECKYHDVLMTSFFWNVLFESPSEANPEKYSAIKSKFYGRAQVSQGWSKNGGILTYILKSVHWNGFACCRGVPCMKWCM